MSESTGARDHANVAPALQWGLTAGCGLLIAGLIILAARGDLWLDEIWSYHFARQAESALDLVTRFKHDNNHLLNTLYLYLIGDMSRPILIRLPAILAGIGSLVMLARSARQKWGPAEAIVSVLLVGTSFPLVLYFSEARGYGPAIFFALCAYGVLIRNMESPQKHRLVVYWMASTLGLLAHSTFAMVSAALVLMHINFIITADGPWKDRLQACIVHQLPPLVFAGCWYLLFIRDMAIGGGPIYGQQAVIFRAASYALGFPDSFPFGLLAVMAILAVVCGGTISLYREKNPQWIFFPAVLLAAPALVLLAMRPTYLYFRYFIVIFPFFYVLLAYTLCRCYRALPKPYKLLLGLAVLVMLSGQASRIHPLLVLGRGGYTAALQYLEKNSPQPEIKLGSDHDFRTTLLLQFYAPFVMKHKTLRYIRSADWQREKPDWFFTHSQQPRYRPPLHLRLHNVGRYHLVAQFRYAGISGWHWFLYRRQR